jgi:hypothetical protein
MRNPMWRKTALVTVVAFALGGVVAAAALGWSRLAHYAGKPAQPVWTEVAWPFPIDQWGKGKAYRCSAADCGTEVSVYIRAKIGFCNCATGVSDDAELDRIGDLDLFEQAAAPLAPGREISVAWMKGRSRMFAIGSGRTYSGLSVGFNDRCDAIVATAVIGRDTPAAIEPAVMEFLNSRTVIRWAEVTLGL